MKPNLFLLIFILSIFFACEKLEPNSDEVMDGTVDGLTAVQNKMFLDGAEEFDEIYTAETGLGPVFVASSCASCHSGNNRGHSFTNLIRFGQSDTFDNLFLDFGAPQIQQHFIPGHTGESIPSGATFSQFIAPIVSGNGYLEIVPDQEILLSADPNDADGDGISGRPHWVSLPSWVKPASDAISSNGKYIGRFGRKAMNYNIFHQTVVAFNNDIGVTTSFMPINPVNVKDGSNPVETNDPDITDHSVNATVFYLQALQAPIQRHQNDADVMAGAKIFTKINCNGCHKETLKTGYSPIASISNTTFKPYTDLLLHDMGAGLDDKYTEGTAMTYEWRTTPLWGLGLAPASQGGAYQLMHDGRAKSIEEAIEMHEGEAMKSKNSYTLLSESDKKQLIKFLKSL